MAHLDVQGGAIQVEAPPGPRQQVVMQRLKARRDGSAWRLGGHRALDVIDVLHHAHPSRSAAFEDLEYRVRYGGSMDHVQRCLAVKHGLEPGNAPPALLKPLYGYQDRAVRFLDAAGSGILADEPGLGKTLQGIAFACMRAGPTLVVCPATAKHVWAREVEAATDRTSGVMQGRDAPIPRKDFVIINYDVLADHKDELARHGFATLIADEVHHAKNPRAKRTKALLHVADRIERRLLLSGTLMMNEADDLWAPLRLVRPQAYPEAHAFMDRYMTSRSMRRQVRGRWRSVRIREGSKNLPELQDRMAPFMIRRTLGEVRDDLPELRHTLVELDLPDDLKAAYRGKPLDATDPASLLRQAQAKLDIAVAAKARVLPAMLHERLQLDERQTLVFSTRLALLDSIDADPALQKASLRIDGAVATDARRDIEERFQRGDARFFLGQTRACSEALTLDAADTVIIAEADWSPQANEQAIRRALRIGTQHPVEVVWLVVKGTLDEARMDVLARKRADFDAVMDPASVLREAVAASS